MLQALEWRFSYSPWEDHGEAGCLPQPVDVHSEPSIHWYYNPDKSVGVILISVLQEKQKSSTI